MVGALNSMQAPYNIHGGTLLGLVRGCNIFDSDIDFVVEGWWLHANHQRAEQAFAAAGFHSGDKFGTLGQEGYEEAQVQTLPSLLSMGISRTRHFVHKDGMKVDMFTIKRYPNRYVWGLWVTGEFHPCTTVSTGVADYNWLGLHVKIPTPIDAVLTSLYGSSYMTPRAWTWNVEPFTVGSCAGSPPPLPPAMNIAKEPEPLVVDKDWAEVLAASADSLRDAQAAAVSSAVGADSEASDASDAATTEKEHEDAADARHAEEVRAEEAEISSRESDVSPRVVPAAADTSTEDSEPVSDSIVAHTHNSESSAEGSGTVQAVAKTSGKSANHKVESGGFWGMIKAFWAGILAFFNAL
jgi:hypothetical protein